MIKAIGGAQLTIDGRYVATTPLPRPLEIEPGHHLIAIAKNGYRAYTEEIDVGRAETKTVDASLRATKQRVVSYVLPGHGRRGDRRRRRVRRPRRAPAERGAEPSKPSVRPSRSTAATPPRVPARRPTRTRVDNVNELRPVATAALTAGAVVAATGAVLFLFDQPLARRPRDALRQQARSPRRRPRRTRRSRCRRPRRSAPASTAARFVGRF